MIEIVILYLFFFMRNHVTMTRVVFVILKIYGSITDHTFMYRSSQLKFDNRGSTLQRDYSPRRALVSVDLDILDLETRW